MKSNNCKCGAIIPQGRIDLGYRNCVKCSNVEPYGCINVTYHKTGNCIQIVSKSESARIRKMSERRGYGTNLSKIKG